MVAGHEQGLIIFIPEIRLGLSPDKYASTYIYTYIYRSMVGDALQAKSKEIRSLHVLTIFNARCLIL